MRSHRTESAPWASAHHAPRASASRGVLTTRPLSFKGSHLFVNLDSPHGELLVEVLDAKDKVLAKSKPLTGSQTKQRVAWETQSDLSSLAGRPKRLRFTLTNGALYSFWITDDVNGASHGFLAAGGPGYSSTCDVPVSPAKP